MMLTANSNLKLRHKYLPEWGLSQEVFRIQNGNWEEADFQIGTQFEVEDDSSSKGWVAKAADGRKFWIPAGEIQCFNEVRA